MFSDLPIELKKQVLDLLDAKIIPEASLVSQEWRKIIMELAGTRYMKYYFDVYAEYDVESIQLHRRTHIIAFVTVLGVAYWFKEQPLASFTLLLSLISAVNIYIIMVEKQSFVQESLQRYSFFKALQDGAPVATDHSDDVDSYSMS
ncbi:F-box protein [uncultured Legionella sp.]|uniref:F-box protein n=1 Tax=uncultured Legionella sp. TaxID=210934 RepID=UPI00260F10C7|nr:F-box protein [uncultured Legionella sp.]